LSFHKILQHLFL